MATNPLLLMGPEPLGRGGPLSESVNIPEGYSVEDYRDIARGRDTLMGQWSASFQKVNNRLPTPEEIEQQKLNFVGQGYTRMPDGSVRDIRSFNALGRVEQAANLYNRIDQEYQDFEDSTFYKVGDAMSDAARVVLSPLIFLKKLGGQDTSNLLDPSYRVRAGYSASLTSLQKLAADNVELMQSAAQLRDAERFARVKGETDLAKTRAEISGNPFGLEGQELADYQYGTVSLGLNPNDVLNSMPEIRQQRQESEGKIIRIAGSPYRVELYNQGKGYAEKYDKGGEGYKAAKEGYLKFLSAIDDKTGIGDMAAIIQFIRTLDPGSVVREGEFAIAAGSFGLFNQLLAKADSISTGAKLTDAARAEMRSLATELIQSYDQENQNRYTKYTKKLSDIGFDGVGVDHFLGDGFQPIGAMQQAPPTGMSQEELIQYEKLNEIDLLMNQEDEDGG